MPILDVELVGRVPGSVRRGLARRVADAAGDALAARPGGTWVTLRFTPVEVYAESETPADATPQPVIARIALATLPAPDALEALVPRLTAAIAGACARPPEHVHLLFEPAAAGRIAFGGKLRA